MGLAQKLELLVTAFAELRHNAPLSCRGQRVEVYREGELAGWFRLSQDRTTNALELHVEGGY